MPYTPPPAGQPLLRVRGVNHTFGTGEAKTQVLFDNNLEVMPGELVIMSGPSGRMCRDVQRLADCASISAVRRSSTERAISLNVSNSSCR